MFKLYNSFTKKLEPFKPLKKGAVSMYNCGPTVYDYIHLGNLRAFLLADILRRYLEYRGYKVKQVMNITDVGHMTSDADTGEDKMEKSAREKEKTPSEIAAFYTKAFFNNLKILGIKRAFKYPCASRHIKEMIAIIKKLIAKGQAYKAGGSVYFDVNTFPDYGALSGNTLEALKAGARVEILPEKRNPFDFALWIKNDQHLMQWESPWGKGYPGWHIECSAMSMKYLGQQLDIHTGGEDNKFPHHECEIAQSQGATGKRFVNYWLHVKHLLVNGQKMSKSLGNFYTLKDILDKGYDPRAVRLALISSHYRDSLNFTFDGLHAAAEAIKRWDETWTKIANCLPTGDVPKGHKLQIANCEMQDICQKARGDFIAAMDDDLNTPRALAVVHEFTGKINQYLAEEAITKYRGRPQGSPLQNIKKLFQEIITDVLGIKLRRQAVIKIPSEIKKLLKEREQARKEKKWDEADTLREKIKEMGYEVEDSAGGIKLKVKS
jgi:cysteinyl-tRNA synthetase